MTDDPRGSGDDEARDGPTLSQLLKFMNLDSGLVDRVREICNPHLERPLARDEEMVLTENQNWFEGHQQSLAASFESGKIDRQSYLDAMNDLLARSMGRYREVLGDERFLRIFGEAGYEPEKLIDRSIFLGV